MVYFLGSMLAALLWCPLHADHVRKSPVSKVVGLLESLAKKTEDDGKKDWDVYETYVCWAKAVIDQKTASNAAASSKIDELKTFTTDIEAGRIEFTSERGQLTKELGEINADIEEAQNLREKDHKEFLAAKDEMFKGIAALNESLDVLKETIDGRRKDSMMLQRGQSELEEGFAETLEDAASLHHAVELSKNMLSAGDAVFLRHLLTGTVPKPVWKKPNRKATFKTSYKARSLKIVSVLEKMQATFSLNLKAAEQKEAKAKAEHDKLMDAKTNLKDATEDQLEKSAAENGARSLTKEEAQIELDALAQQVSNDERFISQTEKSLEETKTAYKDRVARRGAEIEALNKAVAILHAGDARELFKRSFNSQGYDFLQTNQKISASIASKQHEAASMLQKISRSVADPRLTALVSLMKSSVSSHFTEVIRAIDTLINALKAEQDEDLDKKETCEADRATATRAVVKASRTIDETTDGVAKLKSEIADIDKEVESKQQAIDEIKKDSAEAENNRKSAKAAFETENKDDKDAIQIIKKAKSVLTDFYSQNKLVFVQHKDRFGKPSIVAGKAPPPPPATWDAPYGGKTEETTSILAMMEMIVADIEDDISKGKISEGNAQKEFDAMEGEFQLQIKGLNDDITKLTDTKAQRGQKVVTLVEQKTNLATEVRTFMKKIADADPACSYFINNFKLRTDNRNIEIDGLHKAKALLKGGKFTNPGRELKPGDAFLQPRGL